MTKKNEVPPELDIMNELLNAFGHMHDAIHSIGDMTYEIAKYTKRQEKRMKELTKAVERLEIRNNG